MNEFIVRDVRLAGWKPRGDVVEVDAGTPLSWVIDCIKDRGSKSGGDLKVILMCHGLPGFLSCASGAAKHPTGGAGISAADLHAFQAIRGSLKRLELYACLVARIGSCPECGGQVGYDGNAFCYQLAQSIQAEVKASIHLQYYQDGTVGGWIFRRPNGQGINFGEWNGTVYTWGPAGNISNTESFPYIDTN
jgi:hypothetical protein